MVEKRFRQLLESAWSGARTGRSKTVLCTYHSQDDMSALLRDFLGNLGTGAQVIRWTGNPELTPFFPFFNFIQSQLPPGDPEALDRALDRAGIYSLHRDLFRGLFQHGIPQRQEELIYEELQYETSQMCQGIWRLFDQAVPPGPRILILEDVNHLPISTLEFLQVLTAQIRQKPVLVIFTLNERKVVNHAPAIHAWQSLHTLLSGELLNISLSRVQESPSDRSPEAPQGTWENFYKLKSFLCLKDCVYLESRYQMRGSEVVDEKTRDLTYAMAEVFFLLGQYSDALLLYRSILKWEKKQNDLKLISMVYRKLGEVYFVINNTSEAQKWALQAFKLAQNIKDSTQIFYALFILLIIDSRAPFYSLEEWRGHYSQFIQLGQTLGLTNSLAYRLSKPDRLNPVDCEQESDGYILQAISLAKKIGNELRLANAYHILGYHKLFVGKYPEVMPLYQKSMTLRKRLGNPLELAYLNNGTGYFLHQCGDFKGAVPYLYRSLEYAQMAGDYHEMCMALVNISINFLYSMQYEQAGIHLEQVLKLMALTGIPTLSFHTFREILLLYAVSMFLSGNSARAYEKFPQIEGLQFNYTPQAKTSSEQDEILINVLFKTLLKDHEGDGPGALALLAQEKKTLMDHYDIITYRIPFFLLFYGDVLFRHGKMDQARQQWEEGLVIARKHQYPLYEEVLFQRTESWEMALKSKPVFKKIDFDRIMETARANMDLQKLHKLVDKVDFLDSFQQLQEQSPTVQTLTSRACELLGNTFPTDALVFSLETQGTWQVLQEIYAGDLGWTLSQQSPGLALALSAAHPSPGVLVPEGTPELQGLPFAMVVHIPIRIEQQLRGHLFLGSLQKIPFGTGEDLQILEISSVQLVRGVERLQKDQELAEKTRMLEIANDELKRIASTDSLTGLNNRGALMMKLFEERERVERYKVKTRQTFCLLFIDLDNFKYYNDTFGHKLGDALLKEFSLIVERNIRTVDFAARYGGDEFVIILPETGAQESFVVGERILNSLKAAQGFSQLVSGFLGRETHLPEDKHLSCSIGVAEYPKNEGSSPEQLLHLADTALYQAKHNGKSQVTLYSQA